MALVALALACGWTVPAAAANLFVQVLTPAVTLAPATVDYDRGYIEAAGVSGIVVRVKTNDPVGMSILVRCADPNPQIALSDLLVRTLTPPGAGGSSLATYTPILATNQVLWTTGTSVAPFFNVTTDVRIQNIFNYDDAGGAGVTNYTDTLVYTVVSQ